MIQNAISRRKSTETSPLKRILEMTSMPNYLTDGLSYKKPSPVVKARSIRHFSPSSQGEILKKSRSKVNYNCTPLKAEISTNISDSYLNYSNKRHNSEKKDFPFKNSSLIKSYLAIPQFASNAVVSQEFLIENQSYESQSFKKEERKTGHKGNLGDLYTVEDNNSIFQRQDIPAVMCQRSRAMEVQKHWEDKNSIRLLAQSSNATRFKDIKRLMNDKSQEKHDILLRNQKKSSNSQLK
ncbi:hypothetical protein FGO68_gene13399 [Halteria grandinella]|uniref:Uncharacterized protein n=1 Tax=Halteria grandinella TaxID=5974 RepID=A0A8J8NUV5_HALGN|nr:hypothetical protein FGO68_gene13399 [Halteria grandinella]